MNLTFVLTTIFSLPGTHHWLIKEGDVLVSCDKMINFFLMVKPFRRYHLHLEKRNDAISSTIKVASLADF